MLWSYRLVSICLLGGGVLFFVNDLPPHVTGTLNRLGALIGLFFMVIPGAVNLLSSFLHNGWRRVHWGAVLLSAFALVVWTSFCGYEALHLRGRPNEDPEYLVKILVACSLIALVALGGKRVIGEEEEKLKATA
jgi:hypothetical protein